MRFRRPERRVRRGTAHLMLEEEGRLCATGDLLPKRHGQWLPIHVRCEVPATDTAGKRLRKGRD